MPDPVDLSDLMASAPSGVDLSDLMPQVDKAGPKPTSADMLRFLGKKPMPQGGRLGAVVRAADRGIIPAGGAAAGAATGAAIGAFGGPADPVTVPLGALAGGLYGYWAGNKAQQGALQAAPDVAGALGQTPAQVASDKQAYPVSTALGEVAPSVLTGGGMQRTLTNDPDLFAKSIGAFGIKTAPAPVTTPTLTRSAINATRAAADRQGIKLPTTMTSPTGYKISRVLPNVVGGHAIEAAESAAPQAVGAKLSDMASRYGMSTVPGDVGATVQDAAGRWAEQQRVSGGDLLEQANTQAAGIPIAPTQTMDYIDKQISDLSANPQTNKAAIGMLSGLKSDLSTGDKDLKALRDLRSSLYNTAAPEGLTPSYKAKIAGDLWTNLSTDIQNGLTDASADNPQAATALDAFKKGNAIWQTRQDTIKSTLSKVLGSNVSEDASDPMSVVYVADKPPEQAVDAINAMVSGDRRGFQKLMGTLDPDAQDTVRASVISNLGRDAQGNFSVPIFLKNLKTMAPATQATVFGKAGVDSLNDLKTIATNISNRAPRAHGFGSLAVEMAIPTLLGFQHGGVGGASTGILGVAAANSVISHALARPDTLKWVARLASASQKGSDALAPVVTRLGAAAANDPTLAALYDVVTSAPKAQGTPKAADKPSEAPGGFDPSKLSDEELRAASGLPSPEPQESPQGGSKEPVAVDLSTYSPKPLDALLPAVVSQESRGDPHAVSPKGAEGVMQTMPATQRDPGNGVAPVADNSLEEKARVGRDYLQAMIQKYHGNQPLALMAYDWGPAHVDEWIAKGMKDPIPAETKGYLDRILGAS